MTHYKDSVSIALKLWEIGFVTEENFITWFDQKILENETQTAEEFELSLYGPAVCLRRPEYDFSIRPTKLTFAEEFYLRLSFIDFSLPNATHKFIDWAARNCIGEENLDVPEVLLGYQLEHYIYDCDDLPTAIEYFKKELPSLLLRARTVASDYLSLVDGLKLKCL